MATVIAVHEVDDVEHWLSSPKRGEIFGSIGVSVRTFTDPRGSNRVGLIFEVPDMDEFHRILDSEAGAEAMAHDGVHPDTIEIYVEP